MATLQLHNSSPLAYGDHRSPLMLRSGSQCRSKASVEDRFQGTAPAETRTVPSLDPCQSYQTYIDTGTTLHGDQEDFGIDEDGYTCHSTVAAAQDAPIDSAQPQASCHTAAYKLAVRLANRSNGAPLATITEQGSYSTLTSHGSLLSVGRFPSLKAAENTSPNRGSRRRSRSLDEKALHDIQEELAREHDACAVAAPQKRLDEEHGTADPASGTATPLTSYRFELQQSPPSQACDEVYNYDGQGVKKFFRGVLQSVRGVPWTRSRSSSTMHAPTVEQRESPASAGQSISRLDQQDQYGQPQKSNSSISVRPCQDAVIPSAPRDQTRNHAIFEPGVKSSAHANPRTPQSHLTMAQSNTVSSSVPPALPYRTATRSHERPLLTPVARSKTRDVAQGDGTTQASTCPHDRSDASARHTFDGVPAYRTCPSSLKEASSAREVFASQNASFCSTMSTSYSGTVLGIDLDLQYDSSCTARRSQSPPTPVWFTPQMSELERQASLSESPESKTFVNSHTASRSINSSALTSLLPIAAASGIVRTNYKTPKISFYSPSGNLIQPESSSSPSTLPTEYEESPTTITSFYDNPNAIGGWSLGSLPVRPPLVPMTTPPNYKTSLPPHLQHHHNYCHPENPQISIPKGPVKGCGGVVRENSLTPRSGVFNPNGEDRIHRSTKLVLHDLKAEANFYKARFITLAGAHSFAPSLPKGKTLHKRHVHNYETYARKPHTNGAASSEVRKGGYGKEVLGPLAAHALRVCFCQPYDGAGTPTRAITADTCLVGKPAHKNGTVYADQYPKHSERSLPNARVVGSGRGSEGGYKKRATR